MPRSKPVILVIKRPKTEEKQAVLNRLVAQIHANAVIRRLSAENMSRGEWEGVVEQLVQEAETAQNR